MVSLELSCAYKTGQPLPSDLLERICSYENLIKAYKRVAANGGKGGVDGMELKEFKFWLKNNLTEFRKQLLQETYRCSPVKSVKIPKASGGYRQLGIPTLKDRVVQQAIHQVLTLYYEPVFSESSYGFRPQRSAHQALKSAAQNVSENRCYIIDLDLEKFFDEVNHHRLEWTLSKRIKDVRVLRLIRQFVRSGMLEGGLMSQRIKGTPQGGPLSPLLSNIVLDELDKELEARGHRFVRYADDIKIFVKSEKSANRVLSSISNYIEITLQLKVNRTKSKISKGYEMNFLGHSILKKNKLGLSKESLARFKDKIRKITERNRGVSIGQVIAELQSYTRGWLTYFRHCQMQSRLSSLDGWIKRKLRCYRLKQCKRCIGVVRLLKSLKVSETLSWKTGLSGKSWWRLSNSPGANSGMNNEWFRRIGYYELRENYMLMNGLKL